MGHYGYQLVETSGSREVWLSVCERHAGHVGRRDYEYVSPPHDPETPVPPWLWVFGNPSVAEGPDVEVGQAITLRHQSTVDHFTLEVYRDGRCIRTLVHCRESSPSWEMVTGERQPWEARFLAAGVDRQALEHEQLAALERAVSDGDWTPVAELVAPSAPAWRALATALGAIVVEDLRLRDVEPPKQGLWATIGSLFSKS